jgi:hypothetical protein
MTRRQNVLAQIAEMEMMYKRPRALLCDRESLEALARENEFIGLMLPNARLFGLSIEIDPKPNFEVVE